MLGDDVMSLVLPREEAGENIFSRILSSEAACERLSETFYTHLLDENRSADPDPHHLAQVLFTAYQNGDVSALLLELCNRSLFDLLKESYLIPKRFHGKSGENPVLLTDESGMLLEGKQDGVPKHEYKKFLEIYQAHSAVPSSKLYLADGYDLTRYYTEGMEITERKEQKKRGILILYALPDTKKLHFTEAQAYDVVWTTFQEIQKVAFSAVVYYGQETETSRGKSFDELGVLLPIHQFENRMLQHLEKIDHLVLACRENMRNLAGAQRPDV
jgi:hypothetical protein